MNHAETVQAAKAAWDRKPQDFYATPVDVTQVLCERMALDRQPLPLLIREPCCGEGHISEVLRHYGHTVDSSDIRHTGYGSGGVDYLASRDHSHTYPYDAVITNPPFSDAEAFIRRALEDAPLVAMLLPSGFWHARGRSRLFESRPPQAILALTWRPAFLEAERGKSPLMNCIWTVWADLDNGRAEGCCTYHTIDRPAFPCPVQPAEIEAAGGVQIGRTGLLGPLQKVLDRLAGVKARHD